MSDHLYGIFYEDINHAADGGLYPEQVQNRSFEFDPIDNRSYTGLTAWTRVNRGSAAGDIAVATADPLNARNLNYLRLTATAAGTGAADGVAIRNRGFNAGVFVEAGRRYDYSFWARRDGARRPPRPRRRRGRRRYDRLRAPRTPRSPAARGGSTRAS